MLFRQLERWLHQHIFKVGWLLTSDFQVTTVLYYIIFLPGLLLRELMLWLTAGVLNVRAEGSLRFPERQDISELRLSFIRVAPGVGQIKLILISLSPLASGLAALWAISEALFPVSGSMMLATLGSVTELGASIQSLTRTADFWLWLYIVFTVANCSLPALRVKLSAAQKFLPMLALLAFVFGSWRAFNMVNPAIALAIEGLLRGLMLIIAQVTLLNISCVLVLGTLEAAIERISSRSATFRDDRMITHDGGESATPETGLASARLKPAQSSTPAKAAPAKSIYDLRLPIPGPPGREPVSRQAVAVVNMERPAADRRVDQELTAPPKPLQTVQPRPGEINASARGKPMLMSDESGGESTLAGADHDTAAPFARPFAESTAPGSALDDRDEEADEVDGEPFARPFVMSARSNQPSSAGDAVVSASDLSEADATDISVANKLRSASTTRDRARRGASHTRPAPKPSQKERSKGGADATKPSELESEFDNFDQDDGLYDDEV